MEAKYSNEILEQMAREKVQEEKKFYTSIFIYVLGLIIYISKTYFGAPLNFFRIKYINSFVMYVWTFFIVIQVLKYIFVYTLFGKNWELKRIQKIMNQEKINNLKKHGNK